MQKKMDGNCENCLHAKLIEKLDLRITLLEAGNISREHRLSVNEEQTKQVFNILTKIEKSIETIAIKIGTLEGKSGQRWEQTIRTITTVTITVIITGIITWIINGKI